MMETTKIASPQGTQPAHGVRPRATARATDASEAGAGTGAGGFLALLAAMGDPGQGEEGLLLGAGASDAVPTGLANDVLDPSAMAAWQGLLPAANGLRADPLVAGRGGRESPGQALAALDIAGGGKGDGRTSAPSAAMPWTGADLQADALLQGMVAETAMLDGSADVKDGLSAVGATVHGRLASRVLSPLAQKGEAPDGSLGRLVGGATSPLVQGGHYEGAFAAIRAAGELSAGSSAAGSVDRSAGSVLDPIAGANPAGAPMEAASAAAWIGGGEAAASGNRSGEGRSETPAGFDAGGGGGASPVEASPDGGTTFVDPSQAGAEDQVAEQVAYWVNQKTQNAELTLNRDGQPVEVSVTLSGNEAHVSFRSDQEQTRELLDRSMAQLSELLRSEGLVLSGMSVGTSAGQRENTQDAEQRGAREGSRHARVSAAAPAGTASLSRGGGLADRAVDIFV